MAHNPEYQSLTTCITQIRATTTAQLQGMGFSAEDIAVLLVEHTRVREILSGYKARLDCALNTYLQGK